MVTVVPQPPPPLTNEQRWRAQQLDRQVFDLWRIYVARSRTPLYWYDPLVGQTLKIGALLGDVTIQAHFVLCDGNHPALEVPYRINGDSGLTSISDAAMQCGAGGGLMAGPYGHTAPGGPADQPPTIQEAVRGIAQLGGFLGRRGDGEPGIKTLWQGMQRLPDITATWRLARAHPPPPTPAPRPHVWVMDSPAWERGAGE